MIVAGVLIALAADAAWESRSERARLATILDQVQTDLSVTMGDLETAFSDELRVWSSADSLEAAVNQRPLPSGEKLDEWLRGMLVPPLFQPRSGSLEAMIQSGDLRLVRDTRLKAGILEYMESVERFQAHTALFHITSLEAFGRLGERINVETQVGEGRDPPDWKALSESPGLTSDIRLLKVSSGFRLGVLGFLRDSHTTLLGMLDEEES